MKIFPHTLKPFYSLLLHVAVVSCLISCKQKTDYSKEIAGLDSSYTQLMNTEKALHAFYNNLPDSSNMDNSPTQQNLFVRFSNDTIDKKTALLLSYAYEQESYLNTVLSNKTNLLNDIHATMQSINNLKHDLKENLLQANKATEYFVKEKNKSKKISLAVKEMTKNTARSLHQLDSVKKELTSLPDFEN